MRRGRAVSLAPRILAGLVSVVIAAGAVVTEAGDGDGRLYAGLAETGERPGLWLAAAASPGADGPRLSAEDVPEGAAEPDLGLSPVLAGLMSAVVPGSGQLMQGQTRGWLYLGLEVAGWFSYFALGNAGDQAERDYRGFADSYWGWQRYETVFDCGEGLGPIDYETERAELEDQYENARDAYYESIGSQDVYACGWEDQERRSRYRGMRGDADDFYRYRRYTGTAIFLNHFVSAIDAAKSASNRRRALQQEYSWGLQIAPTRTGDVAFGVEVLRRF